MFIIKEWVYETKIIDPYTSYGNEYYDTLGVFDSFEEAKSAVKRYVAELGLTELKSSNDSMTIEGRRTYIVDLYLEEEYRISIEEIPHNVLPQV